MKRGILIAASLLFLPAAAQSQSVFDSRPTSPGIYIGAQGGANWLLNNSNYYMDTGFAVGGGYPPQLSSFVVMGPPRRPLSGSLRRTSYRA